VGGGSRGEADDARLHAEVFDADGYYRTAESGVLIELAGPGWSSGICIWLVG
jgi:hypothetical protein